MLNIWLQIYDFYQQTACGAPVRWSKYTTNSTAGFWESEKQARLDLTQNQIFCDLMESTTMFNGLK